MRSGAVRSEAFQQMARLALTVFDFLRDTKVGDLDATFIINKHICAFDITVDDIALMEIVEA